jgi:hypothetical protein
MQWLKRKGGDAARAVSVAADASGVSGRLTPATSRGRAPRCGEAAARARSRALMHTAALLAITTTKCRRVQSVTDRSLVLGGRRPFVIDMG